MASSRQVTSDDGKAIVVEIANQQSRPIDERRLGEGIRAVLLGEGLKRATISLAVVDDPTIRVLNKQYLNHDWATDALSFVLEQSKGFVEGEIIVSADTCRDDRGTIWLVCGR